MTSHRTHVLQILGYTAAVFAALSCSLAKGQAGVLAATPPMGWNSWNHFAEKVTDADVRRAADAMVASGMKDAGYVYVNIDDTWEGERDAQGNIHPNSKFPDMKALADYVHSKGLKLGIYSSPVRKPAADMRAVMGMKSRMQALTPVGVWISSSTTSAATCP